MVAMQLGRFGLTVDPEGFDSAAELERLGFTTLWIVGGQLNRLERLHDLLGQPSEPSSGRPSSLLTSTTPRR